MRLGVALLGLCCLLTPLTAPAAEQSLHARYDALNALRVDPATAYRIDAATRIELRRGDVEFSFEQGEFAFFTSLDGRVTGAVFAGHGHALAAPRGIVEKQQMAYFLGAPILDQDFSSACFRFTDTTADDLTAQLRAAKIEPGSDAPFAARWNDLAALMNPSQTLRILLEELSRAPQPYFQAWLDGTATGPFDVLLDPMRPESVSIGQIKKSGTQNFYDLWASYPLPDAQQSVPAFRALKYSVDTTILPNNSLSATTDVRIRTETGGDRAIVFELARELSVDSVTASDGQRLGYFQNEGMTVQQRNSRGNDYVFVVLPTPAQVGTEFTLRFHYRGNVIEDAGNRVLFVGARESWYPHLGGTADFANYDLTMRWPKHLRLVATGVKTSETEDGDFRVGHWHTEKPTSVAGFNLGEYVSASLSASDHTVEVFANRELEQALLNRLSPPGSELDSIPLDPFHASSRMDRRTMQTVTPSPAEALKALGRNIDASIRFYETFSGPFPYQKLSVSQIPGTFGQGWPGLLYLSTYSFLPADAQKLAGLTEAGQEHFTELVPYHEVAHQWWGNVVGWDSYRDQWIDEAIANYLALLFADSQKKTDHSLRVWLDRYRKRLAEKPVGADRPIADIGALELGSRLNSSKAPSGFEQVVYGKGAWVIHMLREMLREPASKNPDARFIALLHTLSSKYAYRALSAQDLQREVEAVMTPRMALEGDRSMDWFFEEWVRGTGIPHYRVEFTAHRSENGYQVRGKLFQAGVPRFFIVPVPLYASGATGHDSALGVVVAAGPETSFHFNVAAPPHKIEIDPHMTLLCTTE